jgi:hypothetical protein
MHDCSSAGLLHAATAFLLLSALLCSSLVLPPIGSFLAMLRVWV